MCLSEQKRALSVWHLTLSSCSLLSLSLWVISRLDGINTTRGMMPCTRGASAQNLKGGLVPSPPSGGWPSLLPDPAGGCGEAGSANKHEKHMERMEGTRPSSKQKVTTLRGANGPLVWAPGSCLDTAFPHLWCSVVRHYAAASHLSSPGRYPVILLLPD